MSQAHCRIARLDEVRGVLILLVMLYHLLYDITLFFPQAIPRLWLLSREYLWLRALVPGAFILLCGVCTHLSHSNLRRGLVCAAMAAVIRIASGLIAPQCPIRFGILHLLAACLLLWQPLHRPLSRLPTGAGLLLGLALFGLCWRMEEGLLAGFPLPQSWWDRDGLFWLGLPNHRLISADYFPLLPWGGLFLAGCYAGRWLLSSPRRERLQRTRSPGMAVLGRHTLPLYLLHQPVWFGVLALLRAAHG